MMRGEHDRGYRISHLTGHDYGLCTLLYQGLGKCITYTAKAGLINVPKILKGASAMHRDSFPVIRVYNMVCTRALTLSISVEVLQNVCHTVSRLLNQGHDASFFLVRACEVHELSMQTTNASLTYDPNPMTKGTFFHGCDNFEL